MARPTKEQQEAKRAAETITEHGNTPDPNGSDDITGDFVHTVKINAPSIEELFPAAPELTPEEQIIECIKEMAEKPIEDRRAFIQHGLDMIIGVYGTCEPKASAQVDLRQLNRIRQNTEKFIS